MSSDYVPLSTEVTVWSNYRSYLRHRSCRLLSDITIELHGARPSNPQGQDPVLKGIHVDGGNLQIHGKRFLDSFGSNSRSRFLSLGVATRGQLEGGTERPSCHDGSQGFPRVACQTSPFPRLYSAEKSLPLPGHESRHRAQKAGKGLEYLSDEPLFRGAMKTLLSSLD